MRRILMLALLYGAMQLIIPLGAGHGMASSTLLSFGFLVLAAYTSGELAAQVRLPKITGYLIAGLLFGPAATHVVPQAAVNELDPVSTLAVALIAFLAGAELQWKEVRSQARGILAMMGSELSLSFLAIAGLLFALRGYVPFLAGSTATQALVLCALFASVAMVHSPAVTMALLTETRARGPVARTTLGIVLVVDVIVVLVFSGLLTLARTVVPPPGGGPPMSGLLITWEIVGALIVGAALGLAVAAYMRFVRSELLLFAIVVAFFGAEIARITRVETLLTLLTAGFVTVNGTREEEGHALLEAMERSAVPVYVVFFALAGAMVDLNELARLWPLVLAVAGARALAIFAGTHAGARLTGVPDVVRRNAWLGLVSQAGVAVGLVSILAAAYPSRGVEMQTLFLALIAVNEVVGQVLFKVALVRSGEASEGAGSREQGSDARREGSLLPPAP